MNEAVPRLRTFSERKIAEIAEKLNRGVSVTTVMKEIANAAEFANKLQVTDSSHSFTR